MYVHLELDGLVDFHLVSVEFSPRYDSAIVFHIS